MSRGTDFALNTWNYDGVNIRTMVLRAQVRSTTTLAPSRKSTSTTGGQDPSLQTPGTAIKFIIKQGTNALKGQASFYGLDDSLQGSNVGAALQAQGAWNNVSPRLGFTYDLSGDGKTIARASYARYYDLLLLYDVFEKVNAAGASEIDLPWTDLNGDRRVQRNEIDTSRFSTRTISIRTIRRQLFPRTRSARTSPRQRRTSSL